MNCAFTNQTAQFCLYLGLRFSRPLSRDIHEIYTVENICRIYGRIHAAGNQLPGQIPLVFTGTVKIISHYRIGKSKVSYLRQRNDISCNTVNMSAHFYPLLLKFYARSPPPPPPVKVTVNALAAGCESLYCKIYGRFLPCKWFTGKI